MAITATPQPSWPSQFNIGTYGVGRVSYLPTLIAFGTDGLLSGVIVKTARFIPMQEEIKIEMGTGLTGTQILLNDGDEAEITVVDDRNIAWPTTGGIITIVNPQYNGTQGTVELFQVIYNNYNIARKTEGERTILARRYVLLSPVQM